MCWWVFHHHAYTIKCYQLLSVWCFWVCLLLLFHPCMSEQRKLLHSHCIHLLDDFELDGHVCMVFPLLGQSLYDVLKDYAFVPFEITACQSISQQLLDGLAFLHRNMITHTDLKPENILFATSPHVEELVKPRELCIHNPKILIIDFGSATFDWDYHTRVVTTRHYRAPEVVLECGWSHPSDIWSAAFVLLELYTGVTTFQTHDNVEHLALMEQLLGPLPRSLIKRSGKQHYFSQGRLRWPEMAVDQASVEYVRDRREGLEDFFPKKPLELHMFAMIEAMVKYEPADRPTAAELLHYEFIRTSRVAEPRVRHAELGLPSSLSTSPAPPTPAHTATPRAITSTA
eukprot:m.153971 g.153971  ORF g.153971 m.153971 type:complete len:343 (-) comp16247_c2_seq1:411-1439(-)